MVHLENLLCFHYRPLFDGKSGSFSQTWPSPLPPIQCCFKGDTLSALTQHCTGGRGERTVKLSKKAKCTITFDRQDCSSTRRQKLEHESVQTILSDSQTESAIFPTHLVNLATFSLGLVDINLRVLVYFIKAVGLIPVLKFLLFKKMQTKVFWALGINRRSRSFKRLSSALS